jgi:hypothetical protein
MQIVMAGVYIFFGLVGLGLFFLGAWGSLRVPRYGVDLVLAPKQRLISTVMGLLFIVIAWSHFSGWQPGAG